MLRTKSTNLISIRKSLPPKYIKDFDIIFNGGLNSQHIVYTQIPYVDHNNNNKCIVTAVYNVIYDTLPSTLPTLLPPSPRPAYELRDVPGKGKGLFATRDIYPCELVIVEQPILISPRLMIDVNSFSNFQKHAEHTMNQEDRIKFNDLTNVEGDILPDFDGIKGTNAFGINLQEGKEGYSAVFIELSRLNHSCGPNLKNFWNPYLFLMSAQAVRPIRAGEELTISYVDLFLPCADRRSALKDTYKFNCKCSYCVESTPTSDKARQMLMPDITSLNFDFIYDRLVNPRSKIPRHLGCQEAKFLVKKLNETLATIAKEGVEAAAAPVVYVCLMKLSGILGDKKEFRKWGFKAILSPMDYIDLEGEKTYRKVEQWIEWVRDPEKMFPEWGRYQ